MRDVAYDALRRAVLDGKFHDSERLIEADLAARMGISRTPLREAIHKLELEGFVRRRPSRGVIVSRVTRKEVEDVFETRSLVEPYAVSLAVQVLNEADVAELEKACQLACRYADSEHPRPDRISELNIRFYDLLYRKCPNERLSKLVFDLRDRFMFLDSMLSAFSLLDLEQRRRGTRQMKPILEAIKRRDRRTVARLIKERLKGIEESAIARIPKAREP
jgi:DNA-binding GntR family transcriptional regulator